MTVELSVKIKAKDDDLVLEKEFTRMLDDFSETEMQKVKNFLKVYFDKLEVNKNEN